jgi:hypothetical protein
MKCCAASLWVICQEERNESCLCIEVWLHGQGLGETTLRLGTVSQRAGP